MNTPPVPAVRRGSEEAPCCAFCDSRDMGLIMDFGDVALAGAFLKPGQFATEKKYPMRLYFCRDCYAVQVTDKVDAGVLFQDYFYFSSAIGTLREHFKGYAAEVTRRFLEPSRATVLEFGCNDGVLLKPLADQGIQRVIGVDPARNVLASIDDPRLTLINGFFDEKVAAEVVAKYGKVDMVMANNVYAHIPDIQGITRAVEAVLADDGVFVFEVHYLGKVVDEMQYDMIYHEHLYYYSLVSAIAHFARYDMVVFDVKPVPIHAGSMRFYVGKKRGRHASQVSDAVRALERQERERGFDRHETFRRFSDDVAATREALMALVTRLRAAGKRIAGYGASGRANTVIQYCGLDPRHLDFMIDDAPAKAGYFTPGSHFEIFPSKVLEGPNPPDYLLVFAWSFFEEIRKRNLGYLERGGRMILPLPEVSVYPAEA
jgi:methylation protein EvaC